jgi:hypothetical protein
MGMNMAMNMQAMQGGPSMKKKKVRCLSTRRGVVDVPVIASRNTASTSLTASSTLSASSSP